MQIVILVILLMVTLAMIGVILLQRSEGGGLGVGGGNMGGLMSARGTADLLTRTTAILAALFIGLCVLLAILAGRESKEKSILSKIAATETVDIATNQEKAQGRDAARGEEAAAPVDGQVDLAANKGEAEADAPVV